MKYLVKTNGLTGNCVFTANNPDEALTLAQKHERFIRVIKNNPGMSPSFAGRIAQDEHYLPDFYITSCIKVH